MNSKCLLIAGMHRSGTSLLASWIHSGGLFMGDNIIGAGIGNTKGHFEDVDALNIHEKILRKHKVSVGGFFNIGQFHPDQDDMVLLENFVLGRCSKYSQWGWKEPRTCLFLEAYLELMPDVKILAIYRNYKSVVDSLVRRRIKLQEAKINKKRPLKRLYHELVFRCFGKKNIVNDTDHYLRAWIVYNNNIILALDKVGKDNYCLVETMSLGASINDISSRLREWGFKLKPVGFSSLFDNEMINPEIIYQSNNLQLLAEAEAVLARLSCLQQTEPPVAQL